MERVPTYSEIFVINYFQPLVVEQGCNPSFFRSYFPLGHALCSSYSFCRFLQSNVFYSFKQTIYLVAFSRMSRTRPNRATYVLIASVLMVLLIFMYYDYGFSLGSQAGTRIMTQDTVQHAPEPQIGSDIDPDHCTPSTFLFQTSPKFSDDIIPNIVHYVWLNAHDGFSVNFRFFISVYSASLYFQPKVIYIHTDASPELWKEAKISGRSEIFPSRKYWSQIAQFPSLHYQPLCYGLLFTFLHKTSSNTVTHRQ